MPSKDNSLITAIEGDTFASREEIWRKKKAEEQPRDANGRWIADGARITYKDVESETRVAGTVVSTSNGDAIVERDNADGTTTRQKVPNNTVEVVSSKARLPKEGAAEYVTKENDFDPVIKSKKFKDGLAQDGQGTITRADGYQVEASVANPADPMDDKKNPISYQLFAPGGKSLGTYSRKGAGSFNDMADADKAENPAPEGGGEGTLFAFYQPVRVSRDSDRMIVKDSAGKYREADLLSLTVSQPSEFSSLIEGRSWRKALPEDASNTLLPKLTELSAETIVASVGKVRPYRVPAHIKNEVSQALSTIDTSILSPTDIAIAESLSTDDSVSLDEVKWMASFLSTHDQAKKLAGGQKGEKWASKILEGFADDSKHDFSADKLSYFATGEEEGSWTVNDIVAVDFSTDEVYQWSKDGFTLSNEQLDTIEKPVIIPIDEFSAESLTQWIDSGSDGGSFSLADIDPFERNLFELALSELNLTELSEIGAIVASSGIPAPADSMVDVDGYTAAERSSNAQNQPRAGGGKFGKKRSDAPEASPETEEVVVKARLDEELPLIENTSEHITNWLATAPVTAAALPQAAPEAPVEETAAPVAESTSDEAADDGESKSLYFAIVDEVDRTAVLDVVAITKNDLSEPEAWKRNGADWIPAPDLLAKFLGTSPPPVVNLEVPEPAKSVLSQVDTHDEEKGVGGDEAVEEPLPLAASSGFALSNGQWGIFTLKDLENAISMFDLTSDSTKSVLKGHIRKRAFAMNRMDLVPAEWRTPTLAERGAEFMNASPLYGDHGEVIIAAGVPGIADTPSDYAAAMRLQNYWTRGKGAAKIRWGTPGDLTRAHRHLAKYVGPQRAWGLAQKFHKSLMGVYNHTHDVATGQYRPRGKKRR